MDSTTESKPTKNLPSLAGSLTRALFIGLIAAFLVMAFLANIYGSRILISITNERLNYILSTHADNMSHLLWDLEQEAINTGLKNIVQDNNISGARISEIVRGEKNVIGQYAWDEDTPTAQIMSHPVLYTYENGSTRVLGGLEITVDYSTINAYIMRLLLFTALILGTIFTALGVMVYIILRRGINPITRLSDSLVDADYFTHTIENTGGASREINDLLEALSKMQRIMQKQTLEIRNKNALLDTIIEKMPLGVFVEDATNANRLILTNDMFHSLFGLEGVNCEGKTIEALLSPEDTAMMHGVKNKVISERRMAELEFRSTSNPDASFIAHIMKAPIFDDNGNLHLIVGMVEDVTEQMQAHENLLLAKETAEKASSIKSEFLANMSHELRTPMNSIMGLSRMMLDDTTLSADQTEMMQTVMKSSDMLLNIVNDILDLSKIEAGGITLEAVPFNLRDHVTFLLSTLQPLADTKSLSFTTQWKNSETPVVVGDPVRFGRILTNLVGNAIKFTDKGGVTIVFDIKMARNNTLLFSYSVSDTGIGIDEDKLDHIFEKFTQADDSTTRRYGGTGLGLAITRQLVDMMDGRISVTSTVGQGSEFKVTIPLHCVKQGTLPQTHTASPEMLPIATTASELIPIQSCRVLVAEDHPLNQMLIKKILSRLQVKTFDVADDGVIALDMFKNNAYDLIIMDCHMPNMSGYDTTIAIRTLEKERDQKPVPIIAMTADAMVGNKEKCLACGMDEYVSKPIDTAKLYAALERWFTLPSSS